MTLRTIGEGASAKVKLGLDTLTYNNDSTEMKKVAIKILDSSMMKLMDNELAILSKMQNHPNIVTLIDFGECVYEKVNGNKRNVGYIVFELESGGELFDYVLECGAFNEQ